MNGYLYGGPACNSEQTASCRAAAASGQLNLYEASGSCIVKQYVQYTHLCTINNYLPSVDHCCCSLSVDRLLCCRYHQDRHHYRCTDTDDVIDIRRPDDEVCWQTIMTSWQVLVIVVILSLLVIVLSAVVIYCCCRHKLPARCRQSVGPAIVSDHHATTSTVERRSVTCWQCCAGVNLDGNKTHTQSPTRSVLSATSPSRSPSSANQTTTAALGRIMSGAPPLEPSAPIQYPAPAREEFDSDVMGVPISDSSVSWASNSSPSGGRPQGCHVGPLRPLNEHTAQCTRVDCTAAALPPPYCAMTDDSPELSSASICAQCSFDSVPAMNYNDLDRPPTYEMSQRLHLQS